jgi:ACS family hexuronate transporter-like MFS transporter
MNDIKPAGNYRWTICALVFFATTVNYLDRQVIALLKNDLTAEFNWTDADYANIEISFKLLYAIGMLGAGRLIDKLGSKLGYFVATTLWSIAAIAHAAVQSTFGFILVRGALGVTESGNFPAAIKSVAEWFPKKERALATGIFNSGTNVGALIAPPAVLYITATWGWRWAFIVTGLVGVVWMILWLLMYDKPEKHKRVSKEELDYINSDKDEPQSAGAAEEKVSWFRLLKFRQTWAFALGKFLTDPVWWFYLFWLPDFLTSEYGLKGTDLALPIFVVYLISTAGSIGGGWLPLYLINRNWSAFRARKTSMFLYAVAVLPIVFTQQLGSMNMWLAVIIIGIGTSAHQAWSANIFTTVSDMFPKKAVASVTGIGGMFGGLGGIFLTALVQKNMFVYYRSIGEIETAYLIMFFICGAAYLTAWVVMHFLTPRFERINIDQ